MIYLKFLLLSCAVILCFTHYNLRLRSYFLLIKIVAKATSKYIILKTLFNVMCSNSLFYNLQLNTSIHTFFFWRVARATSIYWISFCCHLQYQFFVLQLITEVFIQAYIFDQKEHRGERVNMFHNKKIFYLTLSGIMSSDFIRENESSYLSLKTL